eukprot:TRINITY_DN2428_c0_g1_i1.p1 TRINITY_DN2428_c0_g1~~TRINITY_DN2428_c0_g1_i1.p1  ORF type:complete len:239 (+),score=49.06 TRINITY_DN2428_c0_g1_i1:38-718(+)
MCLRRNFRQDSSVAGSDTCLLVVVGVGECGQKCIAAGGCVGYRYYWETDLNVHWCWLLNEEVGYWNWKPRDNVKFDFSGEKGCYEGIRYEREYQVQSRVWSNWKGLGTWYIGKIKEIEGEKDSHGRQLYKVLYDDGDVELNVPVQRLTPVFNEVRTSYQLWERVEAEWENAPDDETNKHHQAVIRAIQDDGTYTVEFESNTDLTVDDYVQLNVNIKDIRPLVWPLV